MLTSGTNGQQKGQGITYVPPSNEQAFFGHLVSQCEPNEKISRYLCFGNNNGYRLVSGRTLRFRRAKISRDLRLLLVLL